MTLLDAHIDFAGAQAGALDASRTDASHQRDVEDAMALWVLLFQRLERALERQQDAAGGEWRENDARAMVPAYTHWYQGATKTREHVRALRARGICLQGMSEFMRAYLRARIMSVEFEAVMESLRRPDDPSRRIPLEDFL